MRKLITAVMVAVFLVSGAVVWAGEDLYPDLDSMMRERMEEIDRELAESEAYYQHQEDTRRITEAIEMNAYIQAHAPR